jgi:predicted RNase H-like nuclease (RuvC/YqgF family)
MTLYNGEDLVRHQELQTELGKLEARLQGILDEVQAQNRLLRLGLLSLASRLKKLEDRSLTEEKLYEALDRYFDRKKRAQELLLSWGIPAAVVSALAFLLEFFLR